MPLKVVGDQDRKRELHVRPRSRRNASRELRRERVRDAGTAVRIVKAYVVELKARAEGRAGSADTVQLIGGSDGVIDPGPAANHGILRRFVGKPKPGRKVGEVRIATGPSRTSRVPTVDQPGRCIRISLDRTPGAKQSMRF